MAKESIQKAKTFKWKNLVKFDSEALAKADLSKETKEFLSQVGLPSSAAPFLSFGPISLEKTKLRFTDFFGVGFDGSGNPICIKRNGQAVIFDHDNNWQEIFMNSSVGQLGESLIAYQQFAEKEGGSSNLRNVLNEIDRLATEKGSFWQNEIEMLKDNQFQEKKKKPAGNIVKKLWKLWTG